MPFPIDFIRDLFPALARQVAGQSAIYLDNPSGTQVPRSVAEAVSHTMMHRNANLGGAFVTSQEAARTVSEARSAMADFLGTTDPNEIVIGGSMTSLTLHLSRSICASFAPGDEIIVTTMDHEGNVGPWLAAAKANGLTVRWVRFNEETWRIEPEDVAALLNDRTRLIALNFASNLTGSLNPVREIASICKAANVLVYVDAVQAAPHEPINVSTLGCDFLVCSAYKFFGPHLGIVWGRKGILEAFEPFKCRCVGDDAPDRWETGTAQFELLAGLAATIDHFSSLGEVLGENGTRREKIAAAFQATKTYENVLLSRLIDGLSRFDAVTIYGIVDANRFNERVPTVSFSIDGKDPEDAAIALAKDGIFVNNGHNYALEVARQLDLLKQGGVIRAGIAAYNTIEEIDRFLNAVGRIINPSFLTQKVA